MGVGSPRRAQARGTRVHAWPAARARSRVEARFDLKKNAIFIKKKNRLLSYRSKYFHFKPTMPSKKSYARRRKVQPKRKRGGGGDKAKAKQLRRVNGGAILKHSGLVERVPGPFGKSTSPLPDHLWANMRYCETFNMLAGTGASALQTGAAQTFRLNSLYDCDFTGTGHQPYGYDQIQNWYQRYQVYSCQVRITWTSPSTDNMMCYCKLNDALDTSIVDGRYFSQLAEQPTVTYAALNTTGSAEAIMEFEVDIAKVAGIKFIAFDANVNYSAGVASNPANATILQLAVANLYGTNSTYVRANVDITMRAKFTDRVTQVQS